MIDTSAAVRFLDAYRTRGWTLVAARGKAPIAPWRDLQNRQLTDAEWERLRRHVINGGDACVVAKSSGLLIFDLDNEEWIVQAEQILGERWSAWPRVRTPSGGLHLYAAADGGFDRDLSGPGWTLRAAGCIAVPLGGSDRRWEVEPNGTLPDPAPLRQLLEVLPRSMGESAASNGSGDPEWRPLDVEAVFMGVPAGQRDDVAYKYACSLRSRDYRPEEARVLMKTAWSMMEQPAGDEFPLGKAIEKVERAYREHPPGRSERFDAGALQGSPAASISAAGTPTPDGDPEADGGAGEGRGDIADPSVAGSDLVDLDDGERDFECRVEEEVRKLRVREEARARVRVADFIPPETAMDGAELLARPIPEEVWAVEDLAGRGHNILLAAAYKAGKTTLLLNLARAFVDGEPFLGRFATHLRGRLCWLNYELNDLDAQQWIREMEFQHPERLLVIGLRGERNPLASPEGEAWLIEFLRNHEVEHLMVDTFRRAYSGDSSNDNVQVARFTEQLDRVKERAEVSGLSLSHHFGRKQHEQGEEHGLGAVELDAWADVRWMIARDRRDRFLWTDGRVHSLEESRLDFEEESRALSLRGSEVGRGRSEARAQGARNTVLLVVRTNPGLGTRDLRAALIQQGGASNEEFNEAIHELAKEGRVRVENGPRGSKLHYLAGDPPPQGSPEASS